MADKWGSLNANQTTQLKQSLTSVAWNVSTKIANNTGIAQKIAELSGAPSKDNANAFFLPSPKNYDASLMVSLEGTNGLADKQVMTEKEILDSVKKGVKDFKKTDAYDYSSVDWEEKDVNGNVTNVSRVFKNPFSVKKRLVKEEKERLTQKKVAQAKEQAMNGLLAENFVDFNPVFENTDYIGSYNTNTFVRAFLITQEEVTAKLSQRIVGYQVKVNFRDKGIKYKRGKIFTNDQANALWDDEELDKLCGKGKLDPISKPEEEVRVPKAVLCIPCIDGYPVIEKEVVQNENPVATSLAGIATHRQIKPRKWTFAFPVAYLSVYGRNNYGERYVNEWRRFSGITTNRSTGKTKKGFMNKYKKYKQTATNYMNGFWNSIGMRKDADVGNVITQHYRATDTVQSVMAHLDEFITQKGCILSLGYTAPVPVTCSMKITMGRDQMDCIYVELNLTESITFDATRMKTGKAISSGGVGYSKGADEQKFNATNNNSTNSAKSNPKTNNTNAQNTNTKTTQNTNAGSKTPTSNKNVMDISSDNIAKSAEEESAYGW